MWYFTWLLGLGFAVAAGIISLMWLESNYAFGQRDEEATHLRFKKFSNDSLAKRNGRELEDEEF